MINVTINPTKKYERLTQKSDYKVNDNNFNLRQYREFVSR